MGTRVLRATVARVLARRCETIDARFLLGRRRSGGGEGKRGWESGGGRQMVKPGLIRRGLSQTTKGRKKRRSGTTARTNESRKGKEMEKI